MMLQPSAVRAGTTVASSPENRSEVWVLLAGRYAGNRLEVAAHTRPRIPPPVVT